MEETIIPFDSLEEYYDHVLDIIRLSPSTVTDIPAIDEFEWEYVTCISQLST